MDFIENRMLSQLSAQDAIIVAKTEQSHHVNKHRKPDPDIAVGDMVSEKQTVAIMESMKMETALYAPQAGRIAEIRCQPGEVVEMGEVIMIIDA